MQQQTKHTALISIWQLIRAVRKIGWSWWWEGGTGPFDPECFCHFDIQTAKGQCKNPSVFSGHKAVIFSKTIISLAKNRGKISFTFSLMIIETHHTKQHLPMLLTQTKRLYIQAKGHQPIWDHISLFLGFGYYPVSFLSFLQLTVCCS